ncbi:MAG: hypothetical protein K9W42_11520 [Candidatus Heimdallarchaeota archaeon]|nr:hypothetical protein [Candidatus Heimdallarchaeota archaeon]
MAREEENRTKKLCWNCNELVPHKALWCDKCKMPLKNSLLKKIKKQIEPVKNMRCWRCKGTTSGDICGICGSPLTRKGIEELTIKQKSRKFDEEQHERIILFSPKDQSIVEVNISYAELLALAKKHFKIYNATRTPLGPEIIIFKPEKQKDLELFEENELFMLNDIRVSFKKKKAPQKDIQLIKVEFFYWGKELQIKKRFSLAIVKWQIILLLLTELSIFLNGFFYYRKIYRLFALSHGFVQTIFLFSICLNIILILHEVMHVLLQKKRAVKITPPYFIPLPTIPGFLSFFMLGTAGGIVRVIEPARKKQALFDVFFFPPFFGLILSIGAYLLGSAFPFLFTQTTFPQEVIEEAIKLSKFNPLIFLQRLLDSFAKLTAISPPFDHTTQLKFLHPVAQAGLIGMIINGLNFLPGAILDGGQLTRCIVNDKWSKILSFLTAVIVMLNYTTWALGILLLFIPLSRFRSPTTNEAEIMHWSRYLLYGIMLIVGGFCVPIPAFLIK